MSNGLIVDEFGIKRWFRNGQLHREDGPAAIYPEGEKYWYQNDVLHREDGPAIVRADGDQFWWHNGNYYDSIHSYAKAAKWTDKQLAEYLLSAQHG